MRPFQLVETDRLKDNIWEVSQLIEGEATNVSRNHVPYLPRCCDTHSSRIVKQENSCSSINGLCWIYSRGYNSSASLSKALHNGVINLIIIIIIMRRRIFKLKWLKSRRDVARNFNLWTYEGDLKHRFFKISRTRLWVHKNQFSPF